MTSLRLTIKGDLLSRPETSQSLPLGYVHMEDVKNVNSVTKAWMYIYNNTVGTISNKAGLFVLNSGTAGAEYYPSTPATTLVELQPAIAGYDIPTLNYGFVQVKGYATAVAEAGGCTAGNTVKFADAVTTVTDEAGAAETASTVGFVLANAIGGADVTIDLINKRVTV